MPAQIIDVRYETDKRNIYLNEGATDSYYVDFSVDSMGTTSVIRGIFETIIKNNVYLSTPENIWTQNLPEGEDIYKTRTINGIGKQKDRLYLRTLDFSWSKEYILEYISLKKATAKTQINNTNSLNNATFTTNLGVGVLFQKGLSYGADVASYWVIQKSSLDGSIVNVNAIQGVDYEIVGTLGNSSSFGSNDITVTFLTNYNFKVINYASGYTFASNPYQNFVSDLTPNNSTFTTNVVIAGSSISYTYDQLTPELTPVFTSNGVTSNSPLTIYKNRNITCNVTLSNGWWKRINGSTVTVLTKTDAEWLEEIFIKCDVKLEIRNVSNNTLFKSFTINAFPTTFQIDSAGNYKAQIILTKKP